MLTHLIRIGNSRGVRIPQRVLEHYRILEGAVLELEQRQDGIFLRPKVAANPKVSWEQAYQEMALEGTENTEWAEWDAVAGDGAGD
jgi:antitoxin MazE